MKHSAGGLYTTKRQNNGLVFDPRTKLILLIEFDILMFLGRSLFYEMGVFLLCSLILAVGGHRRNSIKCIGIFAVCAAIEQLIHPYMSHSLISLVYFAVALVRKVLPIFILTKWSV